MLKLGREVKDRRMGKMKLKKVVFVTFFFVFLACPKRSDSGERCEVKKAMKSRGRPGREVSYIFSRSFLLRTAPHYLNAWNRLPFFGNPNLCGTEQYFK